jgi:hypothetical protein
MGNGASILSLFSKFSSRNSFTFVIRVSCSSLPLHSRFDLTVWGGFHSSSLARVYEVLLIVLKPLGVWMCRLFQPFLTSAVSCRPLLVPVNRVQVACATWSSSLGFRF